MSVRPALLLAALAVASAPRLGAVDWPVEKRVITGTFGEDRGDHFNHGVDIGGASQAVHPVLDGEVVFRYDGSEDYSSLPRGTGAFVVLRHSQAILTVYAHLADGSLGPERTLYAPGDTVGLVGDTGRAEGTYLQLSVYDGEAGSYVNPLSFLPPIADAQPPLIRRIILAVGDQRQPLDKGVLVKPGRAAVLAEVYDLREDVRFHWPLAPYGLLLTLDGTEISHVTFDSLSVRDGVAVLGPAGVSRGDLYTDDGLVQLGFVDLHPGASRLILAVRDFAGNETVKDVALTVASDQ